MRKLIIPAFGALALAVAAGPAVAQEAGAPAQETTAVDAAAPAEAAAPEAAAPAPAATTDAAGPADHGSHKEHKSKK